MADAIEIHGTAFKNGSATFLARVVGDDGEPITPANIASATYGVWLLDDRDPDAATAVEGHAGVALSPASILLDGLATGAIWEADAVGYNFRHVLDVSEHQAFTIAGRNYRVEYRLVPVSGQPILVRFRVHVI